MHIRCTQPELMNAVLKVHRAVAINATYPELTGILIQGENDQLILQATDLELGIMYRFPAEILTEGEILLPARIFTEMVKKLPSTTLSISSLPNKTVEITYHQSKIQLNSYDPNNYPLFPNIEGSSNFSTDIKVIKDAIRKVSIAADNEELHGDLSAILIEKDQELNCFNMAATDTHRLAVFQGNSTFTFEGPENNFSVLVRNRALNELAKLLTDDEEKLVFTIGDNQIFVQYHNLTFYARLLSAKFPHYRQIIPKSSSTVIKINKKDLLGTIERATLLARDELKPRSHIVKFKIGANLQVSSEAIEVGNLEEELAAQIEGQPLEIAFNGRYLIETLRVIDSNEVIIEMQAPLKPIMVKPADKEDYFCLILPIRV